MCTAGSKSGDAGVLTEHDVLARSCAWLARRASEADESRTVVVRDRSLEPTRFQRETPVGAL